MSSSRRNTRKDKFQFKPEDLKKVEKLASMGLSIIQICSLFDISTDTFYRRCKELDGELSAAVTRGKSKAVYKVAKKAYELAINGDTSMIKYYLSSIGGWSEKSHIVHEGGTQPITFEQKISDTDLSRMAQLFLESQAGKNE